MKVSANSVEPGQKYMFRLAGFILVAKANQFQFQQDKGSFSRSKWLGFRQVSLAYDVHIQQFLNLYSYYFQTCSVYRTFLREKKSFAYINCHISL